VRLTPDGGAFISQKYPFAPGELAGRKPRRENAPAERRGGGWRTLDQRVAIFHTSAVLIPALPDFKAAPIPG